MLFKRNLKVTDHMHSPLVSVVILNHNGTAIMEMIRNNVHAVLRQDYPHIELVLVDDNSSDGSECDLEALAHQAGAAFATTRDGKHGIGAGRNAGLRLVHGEHVAFLDNDAIPQPGWLSALVRRMFSDETIGACASRMMFADKPDIVNSIGSVLNELFHGNGVCIHEMFEFASWPDEVMYATGNGMIIRRDVIAKVGPFDEGYPFYGSDDADYGMRIRRAGWRIVPVADAVVSHLHSFSKKQKGMSFWDSRNRIRMALKHHSWWGLLLFVLRDIPYRMKPSEIKDYLRCWWSTLSDIEGMKALLGYRWQHRGEPSFAAAFSDYLQQPRHYLVVPDNRAFGREMLPLDRLDISTGDEAYLYHGWYWVEHWGQTPMRWAMRVASLVGSLPEGAQELRLWLLRKPQLARTEVTLYARRQTESGYENVGAWSALLKSESGPQEVVFPCVLSPGDYRLILTADRAFTESGFFPRQIGFGLAALQVETQRGLK